jgi:hypothetical protein
MNGLPVSVRASAVLLAVSGFVVAAATPWHPSIFVAEVVRVSEAWSPLHTISVPMFILALVGAAGLVAVHHGLLGSLGPVGLIVTLIALFGAVSLAAVEAIVFPVLAGRAHG